jgi:single-stranded-DNA-specific exonuclease
LNNIWQLKSYNDNLARVISHELKLALPVARLLVQRGISNVEQARNFLDSDLTMLTDPLAMKGMQAALQRIEAAIHAKEKIVVYGDYDADGVCSIVILIECFERLHYTADYYVPNRFNEGYGLNAEALQKLAEQGYKLIITVDCGISSIAEAQLVRELGMDIIITDHHTPAEIQPAAQAIINPKNDQLPAVANLAGVGVSYKLACALLQARGLDPGQDWLELVAIATVADIVPLLDENRILVKYGLAALGKTSRPGLLALLQKTNLLGKPVTSWQIGFVLAPRLNSAGRLDSARTSIALLLSQNLDAAALLAEELCRLNDERRAIEEAIYQQALLHLPDLEQAPFIMVGGEGWHEGVIGIVASRLANRFNRPTLIISWEGERGKASARSSGTFNLYEALLHCRDYLEKFGGHRMAAGFSLHKDQFEAFKQALQDYMQGQELPAPNQKIYSADLEIEEAELSMKLWSEFEVLAPFGEGNPVPNLILRASPLHDLSLVGTNGAHLKFKTGAQYLEAIAFNGADMMQPGLKVCKQDLLFDLAQNNFRGRSSLQLKIKDIKPGWYSDFGDRENMNSALMDQALMRTVQDLTEGRPVLFIYPAYRSLTKHREKLQAIFKTEWIQELHGLLDPAARSNALQQFQQGEARVFITTQAFLDYLGAKQRRAGSGGQAILPANLRAMVYLWPLSVDETSFMDEQKLDIYKIDINPHLRFHVTNAGDAGETGHRIAYVNRPTTVKTLLRKQPQAEIESGLKDPQLRRTTRQRFRTSRSGLLLVDGTHPPGSGQLGEIEDFILMDSPFAHYELAAVADYVDNMDLQLHYAFKAADINRNRDYLQHIYPEAATVQAIWQALLGYRQKSLRLREDDLLAGLSNPLKRDISRLDLMSTLHILADLGLCRFQKSGSIMAITFISTDNVALQLDLSPYYWEGQKEKELLERWQQSMEK